MSGSQHNSHVKAASSVSNCSHLRGNSSLVTEKGRGCLECETVVVIKYVFLMWLSSHSQTNLHWLMSYPLRWNSQQHGLSPPTKALCCDLNLNAPHPLSPCVEGLSPPMPLLKVPEPWSSGTRSSGDWGHTLEANHSCSQLCSNQFFSATMGRSKTMGLNDHRLKLEETGAQIGLLSL